MRINFQKVEVSGIYCIYLYGMLKTMQTLTKQIIDQGLANRILTDAQLSRIVEGSQQRRYHLVNRAMKAGELVRLQRGIYMLPENHREYSLHPFALAQMSTQPSDYPF